MSDPKKTDSGTGLGFSFNATGHDDTSTEILETKLDSATKLKRMALIGVVLLIAAAFALWTYAKNSELFAPTQDPGPRFGPGEHKIPE